MEKFYLNFFAYLCLLMCEKSLSATYDFQCLTCDNFLDGPGCGEFTREIPVRTCRTFCYFAILHNRSSLTSKRSNVDQTDSTSLTLTRAIRDCSPYEDMSIEGNLLLQPKLGSLSPMIDIITLKRCNSEQCNNDFYLKSDEFLLFGRSSSSLSRSLSFPVLFVVLSRTIFHLQSMF